MTEEIELIYDRNVADERLKNGTKYEKLAALVFKHLVESDEVVHDLRLTGDGKTTPHQIDVTIERENGQKRVVVECRDKNEGNKLGLSDVRDFNGVLVQLQAEGIMLTTVGFTSGAMSYASDEGITLAVLRPFRDEDWIGRVRSIRITIRAHLPVESSIEAELLADDENGAPPPLGMDPRQIRLTSETGNDCGCLSDQIQAALDRAPSAAGPVEVITLYDDPLLVHLPDRQPVRIKGLKVQCTMDELVEETVIDAGGRIAELVAELADGSASRIVFDDELRRLAIDSDGRVVGTS